MKVVVSAILALVLALAIGCSNDENTVNPIPKYHSAYPVFRLKIDNGFRTFGVDSARLTVTPAVGWPGPVYSDSNGFIGTLASGTFISRIDTTVRNESTHIDTSYIVYGFEPSATYNFNFERTTPFVWLDSFRADYAITVDSLWVLFSADTIKVTKALDPANPPQRVLYRVVKNPAPSLTPKPDDTIFQNLLIGYWFNTGYVIADPDDTANFPPDSTRDSTILWGLWHRVDSFFLPPDSSIWCTLDSISIKETILTDQYGFRSIVIDSVYHYSQCNKKIDTVQTRIYRHYDWGIYPGGDISLTPIHAFDTTIHFIFPDTAKNLIIANDSLSIRVPVAVDPVSHDTTWETKNVTIEFKHAGVSSNVQNLSFDLTMPPVEVFPQYDIIIREVDSKK